MSTTPSRVASPAAVVATPTDPSSRMIQPIARDSPRATAADTAPETMPDVPFQDPSPRPARRWATSVPGSTPPAAISSRPVPMSTAPPANSIAVAASEPACATTAVPPARRRRRLCPSASGWSSQSVPLPTAVVPLCVLAAESRRRPPLTAMLSRLVPPRTESCRTPPYVVLPVTVSVASRMVELLPITADETPLAIPATDWS